MNTGDKLICYKSYNAKYGEVFTKNKSYFIGNVYDDGRIGILLKEGSITEYILSYVLSSNFYYKQYFITLAEYREKRINKILNI